MVDNEKGVTLIELLGAIVIFGLVLVLFGNIIFGITKTSTIQGQQIELQSVANSIRSQIESISRIDGIYEKAGYLGKFVGSTEWQDQQIYQVLRQESDDRWSEISKTADGENEIFITDINDSGHQKLWHYSVKNKEVKIKILQQKNENEQTDGPYLMPNHRDTFSIQTNVLILFYKERIKFSDYYDNDTGFWDIEELVSEDNVLYSREIIMSYRDDQKAKGGLPGNGRW